MRKQRKLKCRGKGCKRDVLVLIHALCKAHYMRYWRTGEIGGAIRAKAKVQRYGESK